jgi:hypothetical protein
VALNAAEAEYPMTTASDQGDAGSRPSTNWSANTSTGPAACTTRTVSGLASAIPR